MPELAAGPDGTARAVVLLVGEGLDHGVAGGRSTPVEDGLVVLETTASNVELDGPVGAVTVDLDEPAG